MKANDSSPRCHNEFTVQNDPEMLLAEVHFILLMKREHQGELDVNEVFWLEKSAPFYGKHESEVPKDAIKLEIMTARLSGREYVSRIVSHGIDQAVLYNAYKKVMAHDADKEEGFVDRMIGRLRGKRVRQ